MNAIVRLFTGSNNEHRRATEVALVMIARYIPYQTINIINTIKAPDGHEVGTMGVYNGTYNEVPW